MTSLWIGFREYVSPVIATFVGGYLFTWGFTSLVISVCVFSGFDFHTAEYTGFLLAFPVFLLAFFLIFLSSYRPAAYLVSYGGGTLMTLCSWWLQLLIIDTGGI